MLEQTKKIKILHVDDEKDILRVVKLILQKEGLDIVSTTKGKKALKLALLHDYDLIIIDVMMPYMCGWEVYSQLSIKKPHQKIMFLSCLQADNELLLRLKKVGIADYIPKPFDQLDFILRVKNILNNQVSHIC